MKKADSVGKSVPIAIEYDLRNATDKRQFTELAILAVFVIGCEYRSH
jgi:hypothetical protein